MDSFSHIVPLFDTRQDAPIRFKIRICIMYPYKNAPIRFEMRICMTEPYKKFKMTVKNRIFATGTVLSGYPVRLKTDFPIF